MTKVKPCDLRVSERGGAGRNEARGKQLRDGLHNQLKKFIFQKGI